jgi:hypothetical protein
MIIACCAKKLTCNYIQNLHKAKHMKANAWIGITISIEEEQLVQQRRVMTYLNEANNMCQKKLSSIGEKELKPCDQEKNSGLIENYLISIQESHC